MSKERQMRSLPTHKSLGGENTVKLGEAGVTVAVTRAVAQRTSGLYGC